MDLKKYLEDKQKYADEGFLFFWIFEATYLKELQDLYAKKLILLEQKLTNIDENPPKKLGDFLMSALLKKKFDEVLKSVKIIHVASRTGFSKTDTNYINEESTSDLRKPNKQRFFQEFKRIIANPEIIPDNSVVILNSEQDGLLKSLKLEDDSKSNNKMKKREIASKARGQKSVTDYFKSTKSSFVSKPYQKKTASPENIYEITQLLRGDNVKILTIPKLHYELDPSSYVSVFLLNEISVRMSKDMKIPMRTHCEDTLTRLPDDIWHKAVDEWVKRGEDIYLEEGENLMTGKTTKNEKLECESLIADSEEKTYKDENSAENSIIKDVSAKDVLTAKDQTQVKK